MLIATLIVATVGLVRRWSGRPRTGPESGPSRRRGWPRRIVVWSRLRRPGAVLAVGVTLAAMVCAGLVLVPC
ncbi:hypothetical protein [Nocardia sp. CA-119907]|uniref:hypothetical protein n=1 Tax=Nocardia sp. CA-119907 TaxID=3239973 RepID=UPI003D972E73